jgi:hypothetical protein
MGIGGAIGALAPEMISAGMRNYLLSRTGQSKIAPGYSPFASRLTSDEAARNALFMQQANQPNQNALAEPTYRVEIRGTSTSGKK